MKEKNEINGLNEFLDDELFYSALISELEDTIENELSKETKDIDLSVIDDGCKTIENLLCEKRDTSERGYNSAVDIEKIIKDHKRKKNVKYSFIAACAAVFIVCAVVSIKLASINKPDQMNLCDSLNTYEGDVTISETAIAERKTTTLVTMDLPVFIDDKTVSDTQQTTENSNTDKTTEFMLTTTAEKTTASIVVQTTRCEPPITSSIPGSTRPLPMIYDVIVILPPGFKMVYTDKTQINLDNVYVKLLYSDNTQKVVSINECSVDIGEPQPDGKTRITVAYNHMYEIFYVTVNADE